MILGPNVLEYRCGECDHIMITGEVLGLFSVVCRKCKATRVFITE